MLSETFLILRRTERDMIKHSYLPSCYSCAVLMKLEFSRKIFEKYLNIKFNKNPSTGSRAVQFGQTNGRT